MKITPTVSANFLERIAQPASPFHSGYLSYRNGEITKNELVARLPHVAMLGDSVCMDIYISSPWRTFWRAHTCRAMNRFLHFDASPGICSISKRVATITPFLAIECAGVGALVDHHRTRQSFFRRILGTRNFSGQVTRLIRLRRFPDLVLISIGHMRESCDACLIVRARSNIVWPSLLTGWSISNRISKVVRNRSVCASRTRTGIRTWKQPTNISSLSIWITGAI